MVPLARLDAVISVKVHVTGILTSREVAFPNKIMKGKNV